MTLPAALAAPDFQWWGDGYMGPGMMGWGFFGIIGMIMMFIFWALVIVALIFFIRWIYHAGSWATVHRSETPLEILKKRYARGEIDKKEFEEKSRDLS